MAKTISVVAFIGIMILALERIWLMNDVSSILSLSCGDDSTSSNASFQTLPVSLQSSTTNQQTTPTGRKQQQQQQQQKQKQQQGGPHLLPSLKELTKSADTKTTRCEAGLFLRRDKVTGASSSSSSSSSSSLRRMKQQQQQLHGGDKKQSVKHNNNNINNKNNNKKRHRKIPKIVHQTSKSRCLTETIYNTTKTWEFPGWSYHFHDDEAVMRLLTSSDLLPEFPHLKDVAEHCLVSGTVKADLWRYVVLWLYGGVYADIDSAPHSMNHKSTILDSDDGFFVVEQYHLLSQYFMAMSPRHPLMYYAIHRSLANLLQVPDIGTLNAAYETGPRALHKAYIDFRRDAGVHVEYEGAGRKPVWNGTFAGTDNRSITVVGVGENENEYVWRAKVKKHHKVQAFGKMGMEHFEKFIKNDDKKVGMNCPRAILQNLS